MRHTANVLLTALAAAFLTACGGGASDEIVAFDYRSAGPSAGPMTGAIFTTDASCQSQTNGNAYPDKDAVYLQGGGTGNKALPDGMYFVQVTDSSGAVVLGRSTEANVSVSGGRIADCYQVSALVNVWDANGLPTATRGYRDTPNAGGVYKLWISQAASFTSSESKTDNFMVRSTGTTPVASQSVTIEKFYDADLDGVRASSESPVSGWLMNLSSVLGTAFTSLGEQYTPFARWDLGAGGSFRAAEHAPTNAWVPTGASAAYTGTATAVSGTTGAAAPYAQTFQFTLPADSHVTVRFGNVCIGWGNGHTIGFWGNKNGLALISEADYAALRSLNLQTAGGVAFDPTTPKEINDFLRNANAVDMRYMLSAQLLAMTMNTNAGFVGGAGMLHAPGVPGASAYGFVSVANLLAAADAALGAGSGATREQMEILKDALDRGNNNLNFVQASADLCPAPAFAAN